jgi:hypothetical protein
MSVSFKLLQFFLQKIDHYIGFKKRQFFSAENRQKRKKIVIITLTPVLFHERSLLRTWILPSTPVLSIRDAMLTASPLGSILLISLKP